MPRWEVDTTRIDTWIDSLDRDTIIQIRAALEILAQKGPHLGRPLVDSVVASKHKNMKELRPGSTGSSELRALFAFDPTRCAIMLIAGDKSGQWQQWYQWAIPEADRIYDEHLADLNKKQDEQKEGKKNG
jgi:hypothetical protein